MPRSPPAFSGAAETRRILSFIGRTILHYVANSEKMLLAGTGDRSEEGLGYFCYDEKTRIVTTDGLKGIDELRNGERSCPPGRQSPGPELTVGRQQNPLDAQTDGAHGSSPAADWDPRRGL